MTRELFTILSPEELKNWIIHPNSTNKFIVIDVRTSDYLYGKIPQSVNYPSNTFGLKTIDKILDNWKWEDGYKYVFHCMRSEVRGPKSLAKFITSLKNIYGIDNINDQLKDRCYLLKGGLKLWNEKYGDVLLEEI
ncbi:hypothetical protein WICMUC_000556 [Wickerhamomyces mucosus]|uniref:Rhodanese domain-containing protein n=1 Tax=Wickerhamomyces mucosus TaxID=1378264 RepID=A0A9P8PX76_9ASCO|nr:hypothetical protein WICMUC_000556 [Wickerhamomyces mucosus]